MDNLFVALLAFVPLAIGAALAGVSPVVLFFLSALAIVPLARFIGRSTEDGNKTIPVVGGLLSASFGNAPELIIGILALRAGLVDLVKASITGSSLAICFWFSASRCSRADGGARNKVSTRPASSRRTIFFPCDHRLIVPAIFFQTA